MIVSAASTWPEKLGLPFTRWSLRKLAACLACAAQPVRVGRERLRQILHARGITFQRARTWKESTGPDRDAKLDRIEEGDQPLPAPLLRLRSVRAAVHPAGPRRLLGTVLPARPAARHLQPHPGIRYFHGCYSLGDGQLWGITCERKGTDHTLAALQSIRATESAGYRLFVILGNLSRTRPR